MAADARRALQTEFRAIAMALMVATRANNAGYSTLIPSHGEGKRSIRRMLDADDETQTIPINDIATLLVRNEEIVTIVPFHSGNTKPIGIPSFIVFTNAAKHTSYFENPDHLVTIVKTSRSYWPDISALDPIDILHPEILK